MILPQNLLKKVVKFYILMKFTNIRTGQRKLK